MGDSNYSAGERGGDLHCDHGDGKSGTKLIFFKSEINGACKTTGWRNTRDAGRRGRPQSKRRAGARGRIPPKTLLLAAHRTRAHRLHCHHLKIGRRNFPVSWNVRRCLWVHVPADPRASPGWSRGVAAPPGGYKLPGGRPCRPGCWPHSQCPLGPCGHATVGSYPEVSGKGVD